MASHSTGLPERTHPLLWTIGLLAIVGILGWWFSHWFAQGAAHTRGKTIMLAPPSVPPVDHAALIADKSQAVIDRGEVLYAGTCASCHGATGAEDPTGVRPRNFRTDAFLNPNGAGPYGLYTVLENGFLRMPAQTAYRAEDKYAIVHYLREMIIKPANTANYVEKDADAIAQKIPKPGEGGGDAPKIPPPQRPIAVPVLPLMAAVTADSGADAAAADAWVMTAAPANDPILAPLVDRRGTGALVGLYRAAKSGDAKQVRALLTRRDSALYLPSVVVMSDGEVAALVQRLAPARSVEAAPEKPAKVVPAQPAKVVPAQPAKTGVK
ncbi:MAG: cytochrome c [Planctomycetes bacterium]|nr:cytochrome c [Planctomycetota bacterium]